MTDQRLAVFISPGDQHLTLLIGCATSSKAMSFDYIYGNYNR